LNHILSPEKEFGKGCDLAIIEGDLIFLIEIKECNISISDAEKAIEQLEYSAKRLKERRNIKLQKILLHYDIKGCKMTIQALSLQQTLSPARIYR